MKLSMLLAAPVVAVGLTSTMFVGLYSGFAQAQSSVAEVLRYCAATAASGVSDGQCLAATNAYLSGLPEAGRDAIVADLVDQLAALAATDPACNAADDEIASAIRLAARFSDSDRAIRSIASDVDCDVPSTGGGVPQTLAPTGTSFGQPTRVTVF
jgi:hypothetical protein